MGCHLPLQRPRRQALQMASEGSPPRPQAPHEPGLVLHVATVALGLITEGVLCRRSVHFTYIPLIPWLLPKASASGKELDIDCCCDFFCTFSRVCPEHSTLWEWFRAGLKGGWSPWLGKSTLPNTGNIKLEL